MKKQTKILFPTDFSESAINAFRYALLMADIMGADIELIHVVYPESESLDLPVMTAKATEARVDAAEATIKAFVELGFTQLAWQLVKIPNVISNVEVGSPIKAVIQAAERDKIDLIIMGTRGEHKGLDKFLGNVAAGVVSQARCAVMVVPDQVQFKRPKNIAYATDISDSDPFEIWKMIQLLKPFHPHVHCVHFSPDDQMKEAEEKIGQMRDFLTDQSSPVKATFHHLPGKELEQDLNQFTEDQDIDILVMFQPKRTFLERMFHRSNVRKMAINTRVPLLVQKERA